MRQRADRARIKEEWIQFALTNPENVEIQSDGRVRKWVRIPEVGKYLRVIVLEDGETIHNASFDRTYRSE